ncbi:MAG TPA: methylated-DNA--[protein]-cysteine S-methyltransferase [Acidimicrobiales bacterium]|nr:methylated-DNA--[protein]-cysteine S-methyltransferase [Acidimicrobiales bacterium]
MEFYLTIADDEGFALFDTPIGCCAIAWGPGGIRALELPEETEAETRERVCLRTPGATETAPPPEIQVVIDAVAGQLGGKDDDLGWVRLDMEGLPPFHRKVYEVARTIPGGSVLTYGEVARRAGAPRAARAVGQALGCNPFPLVVPCHRVVAAGGRLGGFSAYGGTSTKERLLAIEGWR